MTEPSGENAVLTAQCQCKDLHFTLTVPSSLLPLRGHICHCSVYRWTHGTPCIFNAPIPAGIVPQFVPPSGLEKLTPYTFPGSNCVRYFCSRCGCHMGDVGPHDGKWCLATSLFPGGQAVFASRTHVYTKSAAPGSGAGGLFKYIPRIGDNELGTWNPSDSSELLAKPMPVEPGPDGRERLGAQCHCGGVSFTLPRPTEETLNNDVMKKLVSPVDSTKWIARLDLSHESRLTSGAFVSAWVAIPLALYEPAIGPGLSVGASKTYSSSSPAEVRSFCGTCGATVFRMYQQKLSDGSQDVIDVSVGILRAPGGVLAEDWLTWNFDLVEGLHDGLVADEELARSLADGLST